MKDFAISGFVRPGYEPVREAFIENFEHRHELGGACCIYQDGEKVVDLWGGVRDKDTGEPWQEDTMVIVYSTTKGLAAMTLALAHSRGLLDYDERVATYWPEFAQNGKEAITVRQLLAHQAGLFAFNEPVDTETVRDLDRLAGIMARERPEWPPGTHQSYHGITLGFYEGEIIRRVDPKHRSLGRYFQEEIATPLEMDFYIRLPEGVPNSRLAVAQKIRMVDMLLHMPLPLLLTSFSKTSPIYRALAINPGTDIVFDKERIYARDLEVPSGGGVGTARSIARAYSEFATGGPKLALRKETLDALTAPAIPCAKGFYDEGLKGEVKFSLGFMKPNENWSFGHEGAFGSPGAGGSLGFADPSRRLAYAYVTNGMSATFTGDPRDVALRRAIPEPALVA